MEKKINLVELLKDCPKGMELDCVMFDNVSFAGLQNSSSPIVIHTPDGYKYLNAFGCYHDSYRAKCVIFPKGKKTWEGFQRPFVDGDVIADDHGNIAIYKGTMWYNKKLANYYCGYRKSDNHFIPEPKRDGYFGVIEELHYASKEEKRKLFDVIEKNDYEWDVENKTLVKKQKFKDGDIVACGDFRDFRKSQIFIFKNKKENIALSSCYLMLDGDKLDLEGGMYYVTRFATGEEKNKLFKALKDNGYRWDFETNTLEKLIKPKFKIGDKICHKQKKGEPFIITEITDGCYKGGSRYAILITQQDNFELVPNKFDVNTLKTFDKVLVRLTNNCVWMPKLFSHYDSTLKSYPFVTIDSLGYPQCIPYNGNEHLCRTTNNCDEFYRVWEE